MIGRATAACCCNRQCFCLLLLCENCLIIQKKAMIWQNWVITIILRVIQYGTVYVTEYPWKYSCKQGQPYLPRSVTARGGQLAFQSISLDDQGKVEKFQLLCLHLIWSSSLPMKIQIMAGKITENLGFKSPLLKVKIFLFFFFSFSNSSHAKKISFILTTFWYLV